MSQLPTSQDGEEGTGVKKDFVGEVISSEVDSQREKFQTEYDSDFDVFMEIHPLTQYENNQFVLGLNTSTNWSSKWQVMMAHIEGIHGPLGENGVESLEDLAEFLTGRVYEFKELDFGDDYEVEWEHAPDGGKTAVLSELFPDPEYRPDPMVVPVAEVTDDERLADLGVEDAGEVQEVEEF